MSGKLRVLLTRRWPGEIEKLFTTSFDTCLNESDEALDADKLREALQQFDVVCPTIGDQITSLLFERNPRTRLLANYGVGYDHIDTQACRKAGVAVTNTPGVLTEATAEIAILLMLMAARRAGEGEREVRSGEWTGWRPTHLLGTSLAGKTLGLVGFGRIAQATARRAKFGLGMNIAYHSRRRSAEDVEAEVSAAFHQDLDELLSHVDVVSLHIPGGAATRHLIDARRLGLMRRDAFLINTARGDVLDQSALEEVLANRRIAGAGLDVFAAEPHVPDTLRQLPNATLLPHLGSATAEVRAAMGRRAFDNVQAYAAGKPLLDPIVDVADV